MPPAKLTAVLGNCKRIGRWKIRPTTKALVVFGNCSIDYTSAYADADLEEIKLDVLCVFGRAVFTLPPGASVQPSSVSMLSSSKFDVEHADEDAERDPDRADLPIIKMQTTTVFGMCRVQTAVDEPLDLIDPPVGETPAGIDPPSTIDRIGSTLPAVEELPIPAAPEPPDRVQELLVPPPPPELHIPSEQSIAVPPLPTDAVEPDVPAQTSAEVEVEVATDDGGDEEARPNRLAELDATKALVITGDDETIHIAA